MTPSTPSVTGTPEIDVEALAARQEQAFVLDVREPAEYVAGHIPGAVLIPLGELDGRLAELPVDRTIQVVCASGNRSLRAARALVAAGIDAVSVSGGTSAWVRSGRPVTTGPAPA
jgi:rhodanese-related sulfurtransferase